MDLIAISALNLDVIESRSAASKSEYGSRRGESIKFESGSEQHARDQPKILRRIKRIVGAGSTRLELGGSAFNTLRALATLTPHLDLGLVGICGGERLAGQTVHFEDWLRNTPHVDQRFVVPQPSLYPGLCTADVIEGRRDLSTNTGANEKFVELLKPRQDHLLEYLAAAKIVHVSSLLDDASPTFLADILARLKRAHPGVTISFDPGDVWIDRWSEPVQRILASADIIFFNHDEFEKAGRKLGKNNDADIADALLPPHPSRAMLVVVKRYDAVRLYARLGSRKYEKVVRNIGILETAKLVNPVGAGDAFAAGFLLGRLTSIFDNYECAQLGFRFARAHLRSEGPKESKLNAALDELTSMKCDGDPYGDDWPITHDEAFRNLRVGNEKYEFSEKQGICIKPLYENWLAGGAGVTTESLFEATGIDKASSTFQNHEAWDSLIEKPQRDIYRLKIDNRLRQAANEFERELSSTQYADP